MTRRRCHYLPGGVIACGPRPPTTEDLAEIERMKRWMRGEMRGREAREYAGLTVGQAAKLSGIPRADIEADEAGTRPLDELRAAKLARLYGPGAP